MDDKLIESMLSAMKQLAETQEELYRKYEQQKCIIIQLHERLCRLESGWVIW